MRSLRRPASGTRKAKAAPPARTLELEIQSVGARGDGVARLGEDLVFVPYTVAGDRVLARVEGRRGDGMVAALVEVVQPGPTRAEPPCPHFGRCGGCTLQHMEDDAYAAWKLELLTIQLARHGLGEAPIAPLVRVAPGTRRRAALTFSRKRDSVLLGFNARASHAVVDLDTCLLLHPALMAALPALRTMLADIVPHGEDGDLVLTLTENGLDVLVEAEARLDLFDREKLAAFAEAQDLARLHWRRPGTGFAEPIARRRPAHVLFAGVPVEPPPGSFLQPTREGEAAIARLITAAVTGKSPVADLFAGCGSFTVPLALSSPVHAVEGEALPLAALTDAAQRGQLSITTEVRDLARRPLLASELKRFQAVVFDPPRAGAAAQVAELARPELIKGGPSVVVAVSCNPATLARDLNALVEAGYRVVEITPIDQFPWSAHLEAVAVLRR